MATSLMEQFPLKAVEGVEENPTIGIKLLGFLVRPLHWIFDKMGRGSLLQSIGDYQFEHLFEDRSLLKKLISDFQLEGKSDDLLADMEITIGYGKREKTVTGLQVMQAWSALQANNIDLLLNDVSDGTVLFAPMGLWHTQGVGYLLQKQYGFTEVGLPTME